MLQKRISARLDSIRGDILAMQAAAKRKDFANAANIAAHVEFDANAFATDIGALAASLGAEGYASADGYFSIYDKAARMVHMIRECREDYNRFSGLEV